MLEDALESTGCDEGINCHFCYDSTQELRNYVVKKRTMRPRDRRDRI